jgi:glutathione synthase/RimK-type ligase-like ATP-grasp enzyme
LVTWSSDLAADLVSIELTLRGVDFQRLNLDRSLGRANHFKLGSRYATVDGCRLDLAEVSSIWFRRFPPIIGADEIAYGQREVQTLTEAVLSFASKAFWMNTPTAINAAKNKIVQLSDATRLGFHVPDACFGNDAELMNLEIAGDDLIAKSLGSGSVLVNEELRMLRTAPYERGAPIGSAPLTVQHRIRPAREFRVFVIGKRLVVCSSDRSTFGELADRRNRNGPEFWRTDVLDDRTDALCFEMMRLYGLTYGAFDLIEDRDGKLWFLELNSSGQWGWWDREAGANITSQICDELTKVR